jgi:membrane-bound lytic murein transglycosylase B
VAATAAQAGMPERAMGAYAGAALAVAATHPSCLLGWNTLAGIGQVETGHGTAGGAALGDDGVAAPTITGPGLRGEGTARVADTDGGALDGDPEWDRAVGPMQFLPATWAAHAQDGDHDGHADINDIDDAALAAAVLLCQAGGDLTVEENWITAIGAYNPSAGYNNQVAEAATRYAAVP